MIRIFRFALILVMVLSINSCGSESKDNNTQKSDSNKVSDKKDNQKNIALVMKTLTNPFFIEMEKGARKAESELKVNLIVRTGAKETSIEQQISIVEDLISKNVDAIVIAPGSSVDLIPVLKKAQDKNIKIVNIDNMLDKEVSKKIGLNNVPFISVDNEAGAYLSAKYISDKIDKPMDVAIIEGIRGATNAEQRKNGAIRAFKENKNINIVAMETANWKIDEARNVVESVFLKNDKIGAIFCANDMMALGAVQYIETAKKSNILIAGFDALDEAKKAIDSQKMNVTINQQADIQGYKGVIYANEMLNGKEVPLETMIDVKLVTKENIEIDKK